MYKFDVLKTETMKQKKCIFVYLKLNSYYALMEYLYLENYWSLRGVSYSETPHTSVYSATGAHLRFSRKMKEKDYNALNQYMSSIRERVLNDPKVKLKTLFY